MRSASTSPEPTLRARPGSTPALLAGLIFLHFVIVALFAFSVIPQVHHPADRLFMFHNGGDNVAYFELARGFVEGELPVSKYPIGFPITLVPLYLLIQPADQMELLEPAAALWSLIFFPLAQVALYHLAKRMTRSRVAALWAVLLRTILPLALWLMIRLVSSAEAAETSAVHLIWAQMLSDGPSEFFTILAVLAWFIWKEQPRQSKAALGWEFAVGALCGFLILLRYTGALTGTILMAAFLVQRRWRALLVTGLTIGLVVSPQLVYNAVHFDSPFTTGYQTLDEQPPNGLFSLIYLQEAVTRSIERVGVVPFCAVIAAALAVLAAGISAVWRRQRDAALILGLWIASGAGLYFVYYYSWVGGLFRFLMPVYPALAVVGGALVASSWAALQQRVLK